MRLFVAPGSATSFLQEREIEARLSAKIFSGVECCEVEGWSCRRGFFFFREIMAVRVFI